MSSRSYPLPTYAVQRLRASLARFGLPFLHTAHGEQPRHGKVQQRCQSIVDGGDLGQRHQEAPSRELHVDSQLPWQDEVKK